ncbi:MAG: hypothetical protein RSF67_09720, partial [Clostridia bacterium]
YIDLEKLKDKMIEIIKKDMKITRRSVPLDEAEMLYKDSSDMSKLDNLANRINSYATMYFCDDLYNYFYGMLAPSTGYIKSFDLIRYKEGFLLVIPNNLDLGYTLNKKPDDTRLYDSFISFNKLNDIIGVSNVGQLNTCVLNGKISKIVQSSEAIHQRNLIELVQLIEKNKELKMILIAGPSSSR